MWFFFKRVPLSIQHEQDWVSKLSRLKLMAWNGPIFSDPVFFTSCLSHFGTSWQWIGFVGKIESPVTFMGKSDGFRVRFSQQNQSIDTWHTDRMKIKKILVLCQVKVALSLQLPQRAYNSYDVQLKQQQRRDKLRCGPGRSPDISRWRDDRKGLEIVGNGEVFIEQLQHCNCNLVVYYPNLSYLGLSTHTCIYDIIIIVIIIIVIHYIYKLP